jgi:flagellar FliJ protein
MAGREFSLRVVQERAQFREEEAGRVVGQAAARVTEARQKSEALRVYREEYVQRLMDTGNAGVDGAGLREMLAFIARIDDALAQQDAEIARREAHWQATVAEWNERVLEVRTYDTLEQRHLERLAVRERRLDQKLTDEWAARRRGSDE